MNKQQWYKDAIIYQLHVRCFSDGNEDGIGDFRGLIDRLDYIRDLGVTAIWLLPFYPSPQRDDGYDISDYRDVHPSYGTLRDFKLFLAEAHQRNLKVITELVINHTSDQHPWFRAARQAEAGSPKRDFYVWSDDEKKFPETRIIFTDTENSNWAWDPLAGAHYWHRFFSHQPDLNHNNPDVVDAVIDVMRFWLDAGVDGLRLDAIPYLCVREGTNNENLPETHQVLKRIRAALDDGYADRVLLAEANQWPEDAREYFGDDDECHMAFHFPLMPRIYMAVAEQDRHPITDIMRQTPPIPENSQWAIFLRNHDELTLEMVTDRERDYMYNVYAAEPRMRVNVGIRRRLAPLMDNDRAKIELLNSLLMSMPGTPVMYYGDELGMGDNIYLGDRHGVRTPMQWSGDRNGGFSRADPARLYLPPIMDPVYGYQAVNVESQSRSPFSLLSWMRRLIAVRRGNPAFGRGDIEFLNPENRKILAYLRGEDHEAVLCVANLARSAQPVALDLRRFAGRVPVELMGRTPFPAITEQPYFLTLAGHGFYWFRLATPEEASSWQPVDALDEQAQKLPCLVLASSSPLTLTDDQRARLEHEALPQFLVARRWFTAKGSAITSIVIEQAAPMGDDGQWLLLLLSVALDGRAPQTYFLPLALAWDEEQSPETLAPFVVSNVRRGSRMGQLYDAYGDEAFGRFLLKAMGEQRTLPFADGELVCSATSVYRDLVVDPVLGRRYPGVEQSNTSVIFDEKVMLKGFRYLQPGLNPDVEIGRFLTERAHFSHVPALAGAIEYHAADDTRYTVALLQGFVPNEGDAWAFTVDHLVDYLAACADDPEAMNRAPGDPLAPEPPAAADLQASYLASMRMLGRRTGQLHQALAQPSDDSDFDPEPVSEADVLAWIGAVKDRLGSTFDRLETAEHQGAELKEAVKTLLGQRERLLSRLDALAIKPEGLHKARLHGDFHLGQVLVVEHDFQLVDFEGELARPMAERRQKHCPLRDVAGMLRSINYAAHTARFRVEHSGEHEHLRAWADVWQRSARDAFLAGYREGAHGCIAIPAKDDDFNSLVELFSLEKALYEALYELDNRPDWLAVPILGILEIAGS